MKKEGFFCVSGFVKERKVLFCVFCFGFYFLEFWRGCDMAVFLVRLLSRKGRSFFGFFLVRYGCSSNNVNRNRSPCKARFIWFYEHILVLCKQWGKDMNFFYHS